MPASVPPVLYDGPNADLVNEVIAFGFGERVLSSMGPDEIRDDLVIITDVRRAIELAADQEEESQIAIDPAVMRRMMNVDEWDGDFSLCWQDLSGHMVADHIWNGRWNDWEQVHGHTLKKIYPFFTARHESNVPLENHLEGLLSAPPRVRRAEHRGMVAQGVASDLLRCLENRAFNGVVSNFWESLLRVYMEGLWPCSWQGVWPTSGKFVAWRRGK
jgi:hypothetical protein